MKSKRILSLLCATTLSITALAGCEKTTDIGDTNTKISNSDWSYIENKGDFIIGITYFEPMNYLDKETGELTGFETEFATAVCEELGVKPVFQKIDWDSKEVELNAKTIDCIWNGLTISDERKKTMDISVPYMENKQIMVTKAENVEKFSTAEGLSGATVVAEKKSAGEEVAQTDEFFSSAEYISVDSQAKALLEVKSGTADVAVIDYVMSIGTLQDGSDYSSLSVIDSQSFAPEQYGIAIRKDSTETLEKINSTIKKLSDSGKLNEIAEKYNLEDLLITYNAE